MIKSSQIRVTRNLVGYPLEAAMFELNRIKIEKKIKAYFETLDGGEYEGQYRSLESIGGSEKLALSSNNIMFKNPDQNQIAGGLNKDWPKNRGIFHNSQMNLAVWVNGEDHMTVTSS